MRSEVITNFLICGLILPTSIESNLKNQGKKVHLFLFKNKNCMSESVKFIVLYSEKEKIPKFLNTKLCGHEAYSVNIKIQDKNCIT